MPDRIVTSHGHKQRRPVTAEHNTVGRRPIREDMVEFAVGMKSIDPTGRVMEACHSLIGKEDGTVVTDNQIIGSFESFTVVARGEHFELSSFGVERQDALLEVGDHDGSGNWIPCHSVRFTVIFNDQRPFGSNGVN